eukprot:TRINITY_DN12392_c0_g1_i1.p1 TRINITY_DN12392_c0_g1~~TRINITY_DN12392_c0_g1_i1.p1  ORF type:complete len:160 (-),score=33.40 TRINITY_DN12392_c0_g1_i1:27-506(-)
MKTTIYFDTAQQGDFHLIQRELGASNIQKILRCRQKHRGKKTMKWRWAYLLSKELITKQMITIWKHRRYVLVLGGELLYQLEPISLDAMLESTDASSFQKKSDESSTESSYDDTPQEEVMKRVRSIESTLPRTERRNFSHLTRFIEPSTGWDSEWSDSE